MSLEDFFTERNCNHKKNQSQHLLINFLFLWKKVGREFYFQWFFKWKPSHRKLSKRNTA